MHTKEELIGVFYAQADSLRLAYFLKLILEKELFSAPLRDFLEKQTSNEVAHIRRILTSSPHLSHTSNQIYLAVLRSAITEAFDLTKDFCKKTGQTNKLNKAQWFQVIRMIRNALNHNFIFEFSEHDVSYLPVTWKSTCISLDLNGTEITGKTFSIDDGLDFLEEIRDFVEKNLSEVS